MSTMLNNNNSRNNTVGTININHNGGNFNSAKLIDDMKFAFGG